MKILLTILAYCATFGVTNYISQSYASGRLGATVFVTLMFIIFSNKKL